MAGVATLNSGARVRLASNEDRFQAPVPRMDKDNTPDADGDFSNAPIFNFNFNDGKVKFNAHWYVHANENYGSASAFLSQ